MLFSLYRTFGTLISRCVSSLSESKHLNRFTFYRQFLNITWIFFSSRSFPGRGQSKVKESVKVIEEIGRVHRSNSGWESKRAVDAGLLTHIYRTSSLLTGTAPAHPRHSLIYILDLHRRYHQIIT